MRLFSPEECKEHTSELKIPRATGPLRLAGRHMCGHMQYLLKEKYKREAERVYVSGW